MDLLILKMYALPLIFMIAGMLLLVKGGDWTINSSVFTAKRFGLSPLIVGFTILAVGTSLPELVVSLLAVLRGSGGIAMGNVIGSNIANILCVLGACTFVATIYVRISTAFLRDIIMMMLCAFLLIGLMMTGGVSRLAGGCMVGLLIFYISMQYRAAARGDQPVDDIEEEVDANFSRPLYAYLFLALGLVAVSGGAELLVRGASNFALILGVPEAVIGLSIIALGTSLPELSTSVIASKKGHTDMMLGNIIGSNVFNILVILGITALVKPILSQSYDAQLLDLDVWVMLGVFVVFSALVLSIRKLDKTAGALFLCAYIGYNIYIYAINLGG